jgi:hypothetical protein
MRHACARCAHARVHMMSDVHMLPAGWQRMHAPALSRYLSN